MIIHQPEFISKDGQTIVWSRVELAKRRTNFPDYFWYRVPERYAPYLSLQSDAFLAPGLIAAMHFGEDIDVQGVVSPRLAYHLDEYQFLLNFHQPNDVWPVSIRYEHLAPLAQKPEGVACTFSGGVDSFFTLQKHLPQSQPITDYQITHALFIDLFDIVYGNAKRYDRLLDGYRSLLGGLGVELVPMQTNLIRVILPRLKLPYFFGPVLAGCGMILGGLFKRYYVSASRDHAQLAIRASSSNPLSDRLLSTDTLDIIHYGGAYRRVKKVEALCNWQPVREHLRVCGSPDLDGYILNCSRCEKCMRTMIPLYALGKLDQFKTFSKPFRTNSDVLRWARKYDPRYDQYAPETFTFVKRHKPGLLPWLWLAAFLGTIRYQLLKLLPAFLKRWLMQYGFFIDKLKQENAFENPVVINFISSMDSKE